MDGSVSGMTAQETVCLYDGTRAIITWMSERLVVDTSVLVAALKSAGGASREVLRLNKLVDEWASMALAQFDAETRFLVRAARGSAQRGLALLDKLDQSASRRSTKAGH